MKTAVVIGAGVAGLATSALLAREGYRVTILEQGEEVGGRAGSLEAAGFRWDTGPSWYLMPETYEHFYALMGTSAEKELDLIKLHDPAYRVFSESNGIVDVPSGADNLAKLFESIEKNSGEKIRSYLKSAEETYNIAVERFLYTNFETLTPIVAGKFWKKAGTFLKSLTVPLSTFVDRRFSTPILRQILTYPAVFLSNRPEKTPAMYHLMSYADLVQGVFYPRGGFAAVIDSMHRIALSEGVEFRLGATVCSIITTQRKAVGVRYLNSAGNQEELAADIVVSTADMHHTETTLLPAELQTYPQSWFDRRNPGVGTVIVLAGVRGKLPDLSSHNLFFSADWSPDFDAVFNGSHPERPLSASKSIYVAMPSASDDTVAPEDCENLYILIPVPADPEIGHGDAYHSQASSQVSDIANAALAQIAEQAGISDLEERIIIKRTLGPADFSQRYNAWHGGALGPAHTLRQSAFLRGRNVSAKVGNLFYAGATTVPGVGVPMCLISAENVIKRLRGDRSASPLPEPNTH